MRWGFPHSTEPGRSLDKAKKSQIEDWIPQLTITEEEGSQPSEHKAFTAASETLVEEKRHDVEDMEYSESDGDVNYDFAQDSFEEAKIFFSANEHDQATKLFRSGLDRANRLSHRFRRRKEKEQETSDSISKLEAQVREMTEEKEYYQQERDFLQNVVLRNQIPIKARPLSPRRRRCASLGGSQAPDTETTAQNGGRNTRKCYLILKPSHSMR